MLSLPPETKTLGSRDLAQLLVYWLDKKYVPEEMATTIYDGMVPDLFDRGKRVETEGDETAMKCRWVKQLVHRELDVAREEWLGRAEDVLVDLDVDFEMQEAP